MPQTQTPTSTGASAAGDTSDAAIDPAEARAFAADPGPSAVGQPATELLTDDEPRGASANTAPEATASGEAEFKPAGGASGDTASSGSTTSGAYAPLIDAATTLLKDARNLLEGQAGKLRGQAEDAYGQLRTRTADHRVKAEAFIQEKPYTAVGVGVLTGLILARLMRRR